MENIVAESLSPVDGSNARHGTLAERVKGIEKNLEWIIRLLFVLTAGMLALLVLVYEIRGTLLAIQASLLH